MSKKRKKRNKKYQGADAQSTTHSFTAEELETEGKKKKRKKWLIIGGIALVPLLVVLELIF